MTAATSARLVLGAPGILYPDAAFFTKGWEVLSPLNKGPG